jgi:hypothetical protein
VRTAIFSTFPPRACGIGVFASDLREALLDVGDVDHAGSIVVVDEPSSPQGPDVLATVSQSVRGDYLRAARLLGRLNVDVVLLQHEYGIFGGRDGERGGCGVRPLVRRRGHCLACSGAINRRCEGGHRTAVVVRR